MMDQRVSRVEQTMVEVLNEMKKLTKGAAAMKPEASPQGYSKTKGLQAFCISSDVCRCGCCFPYSRSWSSDSSSSGRSVPGKSGADAGFDRPGEKGD